MSAEFTITDVEAWLNLDRIEFPVLSSSSETGDVYEVKKVGFVLVDEKSCKARGLAAQQAPGGKCALPTAVVRVGDEYELFSLSLELSDWVQHCVGMALSGMNAFPCKVEFGALDGRLYAEVL